MSNCIGCMDLHGLLEERGKQIEDLIELTKAQSERIKKQDQVMVEQAHEIAMLQGDDEPDLVEINTVVGPMLPRYKE